MSSPTQRSLKHLRDAGWTACIVEKRIPFRNITVDAFGFGDILAFRHKHSEFDYPQIALVQTTSGSHAAHRRAKILSLTEHADWKAAGGIIILHGWAKQGPRGKRKRWTLREEIL